MGPTTDFPAFYSKSSGHHAPYCVNSVTEAARIIKEHRNVGLHSGLLFAVPVPDRCALDDKIIDDIIKNALEKADREGIKGKHITPFLLAEIASLTGGNSLETSIRKKERILSCNIPGRLTRLSPGITVGINLQNEQIAIAELLSAAGQHSYLLQMPSEETIKKI
ncbi:pseudouridine-5'-phosphate glycosidase-like [Rhynchophorus ferrugineus]|uniref:pseudouridine-5'-phosphate glycosidase-like n=1 Tax=Rhynchophorus ferrugineus TaxID=354439 RepID=UPI003FCD8190